MNLKSFVITKKLKVGLAVGLLFSIAFPVIAQAQVQVNPFSGNDTNSYQCLDKVGNRLTNTIYKDPKSGYYLCAGLNVDGIEGDDRAYFIPPTLQQIEIWFVRILYIIWAVIASFSFVLLVVLGYQYILRGGTTDTQLVELRKRIINYVIGFILVFLAVPILTTVFRLFGVNTEAECYDVNMPGFQFFFDNICTGNETYLRNACTSGASIPDGLACGNPGSMVFCGARYITTTQIYTENIAPTDPSNPGNQSVGAANGMFFVCSVGTGSVGRSLWVQN